MKDVLLFGGGMMAGPVVEYLGRHYRVHVAALAMDKETAKAVEAANADFRAWDINDLAAMNDYIRSADLVISLLPAWFHAKVARVCIEAGKNMVTASYASNEMRGLDAKADEKGVLLLNECGADPGIDHMSAKKLIDEVRAKGHEVTGFRSYTGGLPAPDANNNPWAYKFSWSPRSVITAAKSNAHYLEQGQEVVVPAKQLFQDTRKLDFIGIGTLDAYPNRDSMPYIGLYGLHGVATMFRGTLRYPGWCELWDAIVRLGMLEDEKPGAGTYAQYTLGLVNGRGEPSQAVAGFLGISKNDPIIKKLAYIGLFDKKTIRSEPEDRIRLLADLMAKKLQFRHGERDMLVMRHIFDVRAGEGSYTLRSTMIEYGRPDGLSAMARTVGLPVAIAADMVLRDRIPLTGVRIPTLPVIYNQVLSVLETEGMAFKEEIIESR